ncbi:MAG: hypothetical protein D6729_12900 [Deltaproteobacteria bacterium]|nr:MAG: hypothetical protein D6729_12900 [Deltaproteobacteria bacterium]
MYLPTRLSRRVPWDLEETQRRLRAEAKARHLVLDEPASGRFRLLPNTSETPYRGGAPLEPILDLELSSEGAGTTIRGTLGLTRFPRDLLWILTFFVGLYFPISALLGSAQERFPGAILLAVVGFFSLVGLVAWQARERAAALRAVVDALESAGGGEAA